MHRLIQEARDEVHSKEPLSSTLFSVSSYNTCLVEGSSLCMHNPKYALTSHLLVMLIEALGRRDGLSHAHAAHVYNPFGTRCIANRLRYPGIPPGKCVPFFTFHAYSFHQCYLDYFYNHSHSITVSRPGSKRIA